MVVPVLLQVWFDSNYATLGGALMADGQLKVHLEMTTLSNNEVFLPSGWPNTSPGRIVHSGGAVLLNGAT